MKNSVSTFLNSPTNLVVGALFCACITLVGCGKEKNSRRESGGPVTYRPGEQYNPSQDQLSLVPTSHTIMVIDDGFDPEIPEIKNHLKNSYTIDCKDDDEDSLIPSIFKSTSTQVTKEELLRNFDNYNSKTTCHLTGGSTPNISPQFANIAASREQWNEAIKSNFTRSTGLNRSQLQQIAHIIDGENDRYLYHGTSTAGLVGYQNSNTSIVIVERHLSSQGESQDFFQSTPCPRQTQIDYYGQLLSDPEIIERYARIPPSALDQSLYQIQVENQITLYNMSYGSPPSQVLNQNFAQKGCAPVNYAPYFNAVSNLEVAKLRYQRENNITYYQFGVGIKAAGNDGLVINSSGDAWDCPIQNDMTVMVGALTPSGTIADFSNRGQCVDGYAVGAKIIGPGPNSFLTELNGTSFAAPLAARYFSQTIPPNLTSEQAIQEIKNIFSSNPGRAIPQSAYPAELFGR